MPTVNCNTGIVAVAWNYTSLSDVLHTVTAVDAAGRQHNCSGVSSSGCDLTALDCGTKYNLTVTPSRNGCVGRDSPTKTITTGGEHFFFFPFSLFSVEFEVQYLVYMSTFCVN